MAARRLPGRPHIVLKGTSTAEPFTSPVQGGGKLRTIPVDRARHGNELREQLEKARELLERRRGRPTPAGVEAPNGSYIEFRSPAGYDLKLESLDYRPAGIELVAVRRVDDETHATVFVPHGKIGRFVRSVHDYLTKTSEKGTPRNRELIESIAEIRLALAESFWTDDVAALPERHAREWWEIWLRGEGDDVVQRFRRLAKTLGIEAADRHLVFPERTVVLARATLDQIAGSLDVLDVLTELRRPTDVGGFFTRQPPREQAAWIDNLVERTTPPAADDVAVCILDTGVNRAHRLLSGVLSTVDRHTCQPSWGVDDHDGHGTTMAGIATYGDLRTALTSTSPLELRHRLESSKIIPPKPDRNRKELYGALTVEGIARAELQAPERLRVIAMAITSTEDRDRGQPTSWSSAVDGLCAGIDGHPRLFFVSAGNASEGTGLDYRAGNESDGIHDPAQAWNALTIGAYTERMTIDEESYAGWAPIAPRGDLSPTTTTSCVWERQWPIKPELVMEGGNMAVSPEGGEADFPDSLSVLSTYYRPETRQLDACGDTSAATAAGARLGAIVRSQYPERWPETVRALLVDSAQWTERMQTEIAGAHEGNGVEHLLRCFGYGVPSLRRALYSAGNALTLIVEDELQPFSGDASNEMHLHRLPWPRAELLSLRDTPVELRVTLSYFVEPNPARLGWRKKHRYASHGLRFAVQMPSESVGRFQKRVNKAARDEDEKVTGPSDSDGWVLNTRLRSKGSLHHDRWHGMAADLATRDHIAVFPVIGWWRERLALGRSESRARYSLVVSIRTPETTVDLYQAIQTKIATVVPT